MRLSLYEPKSDTSMKNQACRVLLVVNLVLLCHCSFSQCTPSPPAVNACGGGNGAASNGLNINAGETYWYSGGPGTFGSGINLNGGTLRVCGNLTLSALNFNSGRIIIESGGSLTVNTGGDLYLNGNASITNRGFFSINHGIHMQNANNRIWNDATTALFTVQGTIEFNSNSSKLINRGIVNANDIFIQGSALAGAICLEGGAVINTATLTNNFTGGIAYNGTGTPACVSVSTSAQRNSNVASSSLVDVCTASGISYSGGANWGSATVITNCSSCYIALAEGLLSFGATAENGRNKLQWITADHSPATAMFYVEASADGIHFHTIGSVYGEAGKSIYTFYDREQTNAAQYYRLQQIVPGGRSGYSTTVSVHSSRQAGLQVFPNPVHAGSAVTFIADAAAGGNAKLSLIDVNGKTVMQKSIALTGGSNRFDWNVSAAGPGVYIARIEGINHTVLYSRALVITK